MGRLAETIEPLLTGRRVRRMKAVLASRSDHVAFVFERMVDPHNLSAALRSLDAFSFQDAHLIQPSEALGLSRGITIGSERWLSLHRHEDTASCLGALKGAGYRVYASEVAGEGALRLEEIDLRRRAALVFGNEHAGVSEEVLALADERFRIEMLGFGESLNLSVAVAISAFHARATLARLMTEDKEPERYLLPPERRKAIYAQWLRQSVKRPDVVLGEDQEI